jgi:hypothetical protein
MNNPAIAPRLAWALFRLGLPILAGCAVQRAGAQLAESTLLRQHAAQRIPQARLKSPNARAAST